MSYYADISSTSSAKHSIDEDSFVRKAAACVPMLGIISSFFNETSLHLKINSTFLLGTKDVTLRQIEVKNHYKIASIIRETICIAIIVTLMAIGILHGKTPLTIGGVCMGVFAGIIAWHAHAIRHNKRLMSQLDTSLMLSTELKVK